MYEQIRRRNLCLSTGRKKIEKRFQFRIEEWRERACMGLNRKQFWR